MKTYEPIIGLEIHVQLKTRSKLFCNSKNGFEEGKPNVNVCPVCMGHPGVLPVLNQQALEWAMKLSLALNLEVQSFTKFDRKNYFYPDLPKGYQISQYDQPLALNGWLEITGEKGGLQKIRIQRLHLEEDAAKNIHRGGATLVDFNRAGSPLCEIVTHPDFHSPQEAKRFLQELRMIIRALGVSDADMEKGHLRCDANVSVRPVGDDQLHPKTEIKNLNSFRSVEGALIYEIKRQTQCWEEQGAPQEQTTRGWDEKRNVTVEQRHKESEGDYRYFPEPDLPPLTIESSAIASTKRALPELPQATRKRFVDLFEFSRDDAFQLTQTRDRSDFLEQTMSELFEWVGSTEEEGTREEKIERHKKKLAKLTANWILTELFRRMNEKGIGSMRDLNVTPENFAELMTLIFLRRVNSSAGQTILTVMLETGKDPSHVMAEENLEQVSDAGTLDTVVIEVIAENPDVVETIRKGKDRAIQFLVGLVMKKMKGKADPAMVLRLLQGKLKI